MPCIFEEANVITYPILFKETSRVAAAVDATDDIIVVESVAVLEETPLPQPATAAVLTVAADVHREAEASSSSAAPSVVWRRRSPSRVASSSTTTLPGSVSSSPTLSHYSASSLSSSIPPNLPDVPAPPSVLSGVVTPPIFDSDYSLPSCYRFTPSPAPSDISSLAPNTPLGAPFLPPRAAKVVAAEALTAAAPKRRKRNMNDPDVVVV